MAFSAGFDASILVNSVDISAYTTSVKFSPARKDFDLPVLGAAPVKSMVGPTKTTVDLSGFIDATATNVFTALMAQTVPAAVPIVFGPQGTTTGLPKRTCNAFVVDFSEDTPSEGPGKWTAKLTVDGAVTFTVD